MVVSFLGFVSGRLFDNGITLLYSFTSPKKEVPMASLNRCCILALFVFLCQMPLLLIQTLPLQAEEISQDVEKGQGGRVATEEKAAGVEGIATYYAKRYNGRKTNSGERYKPEKLTAAHPSFPLGTKVKVVNLSNRNEVIVRINDRCRKRKSHETIDLSRAAAKKLGFFGKGMARVLIVPVEEEPS
jgi:rare lipoprotein A